MSNEEKRPREGTLRFIDLGDEHGLVLWGLVLGVPVEGILTAVDAVGPEAQLVQAEIEAHPDIYKAKS
ncbi:hypothetical protein ABIE56_000928 [Luteibacter sp. 621]|uniref:hypothetical protein n=1 Tax=Luteibacter sp. 621 TaxID=3373916 RepID=UPI003D1CA7EB